MILEISMEIGKRLLKNSLMMLESFLENVTSGKLWRNRLRLMESSYGRDNRERMVSGLASMLEYFQRFVQVIRRLPVASLRGVVRAVGVYPLPRLHDGSGVQGADFCWCHTAISIASITNHPQ